MKKFIITILSALLIISLCSCSNTAQRAIEQGKLSMASGDYQTALNSLQLAKSEGARGDALDDMISIIQNYIEAKEAYDEDNIDGANEALNKITQDYSEYTIKNDIEKLKSDIAAKQSTMSDIDIQIAGTKKLLASGDYVSTKANISELYTKNLTEYQKNQVDELNKTLASAQSKIDAASQTEPEVVYVQPEIIYEGYPKTQSSVSQNYTAVQNVEDKVTTIRGWYNLTNSDASSAAAQGLTKKTSSVSYNGSVYTSEQYYRNGELYFVFAYIGTRENRLYFWNGTLFRWIDESKVTHDNEFSNGNYLTWQSLYV